MCRSIRTLRPPYTDDVTPADVEAAALQYVRKIAGMRKPSAQNQETFDAAVQAVAQATAALLGELTVRSVPTRTAAEAIDRGLASSDQRRRAAGDALLASPDMPVPDVPELLADLDALRGRHG